MTYPVNWNEMVLCEEFTPECYVINSKSLSFHLIKKLLKLISESIIWHTLPSCTLVTEDLSAAGNKKKLMSTS